MHDAVYKITKEHLFYLIETARAVRRDAHERMRNEGIAVDDCCWCSANEPLALGDLIEGHLHSFPDLSNIPTLVIK